MTGGPGSSNLGRRSGDDGPGARHLTGWLFVAVQAVLLVVLILLPGADHWPVPGWLSALGYLLMAVGVAVMIAAGLRLGPSLTPTPMPTAGGQLTTTGLYRYTRHPIYSGVLALVAGIVVRSGSVVVAAVGLLTLAFFTAKARWEEARLRERYPGYAAYAATTGRFIPRLRR